MTRQDIVDKVLAAAREKVGVEVGGLLGTRLQTVAAENRLISKADYFQSVDKIVLTKMKVEGEQEGEAYIAVSIKDAVLFGGTLIMLPETELEDHVNRELFGDDEADAFGEIANIIAGVYSTSFEELYPEKIRLIKSELEVVLPTRVEVDSPQPIPDQTYYMTSHAMNMDGRQLGNMQLLFPAALLGISGPEEEPVARPGPAAPPEPPDIPAADATEQTAGSRAQVLVIAQQDGDGEIFTKTIQECGYSVQPLAFTDDLKSSAAAGVLAVFLVMHRVDEQGMAAIIKARSACGDSASLVAAGPQWTKKTVLQAVKHGACDILVSPATEEEIRRKVELYLDGDQQPRDHG